MKVDYILRPIISGLPLLWRLLQSLRLARDEANRIHYYSAANYLSGIVVVFLSTFRYAGSAMYALWIVSLVVTTVVYYLADVFGDWGLHPIHLRHTLLFP